MRTEIYGDKIILKAYEESLIPSQKAAGKSGAMREGILRKCLMIGGRVHDVALFFLVREDFQK